MKKIIVVALSVILCLSVTACTKNPQDSEENAATEQKAEISRDTDTSSVPDNEDVKTVTTETDESSVSYAQALTVDQAQSVLKVINEALSGYLWTELMDRTGSVLNNVGDSTEISLTDAEMIRASALACSPDDSIDTYFTDNNGKIVMDENAQSGPFGNGYHGRSVSNAEVEQYCLDLFGAKADWDQFQTEEKCEFFDAVKYTDDTGTYAIILDNETETETDMESHTYRVSKSGDEYIGEVDIFWGYWGELSANPGFSNYTVTYGLEPDNNSIYGLIVTSISVKMIADKPQDSLQESAQESPQAHRPFYGIWCSASKNESDAQKEADKLISMGFDGQVYVSSDWSNLNSEKWYVITAGSFDAEEDAKAVLGQVKNAGYPSAYVKYSGDYTGDPD